MRAALEGAESELGPVDVLVNNAGYDEWSWFTATDEALWQRVLAVNLVGVIACTHAVLPGMQERRRGRIVNVSSEAGRVGSSGSAVYSAAKGGVLGFTKALAIENGRYGITVERGGAGADRDAAPDGRARAAGRHRQADRRHDDQLDEPAQARPPGRGGRRDRLPRLRRRLVRDGAVARGERRPCQNLSVPEHVRIREVGPRDGFQNEPEVIATEDKVRLVELLARTGVRRLEVTSFVRADVIPQLADGAEVLRRAEIPDDVAVTVLIPNERGLENALELRDRFQEVNLFLSASETHNRKNVNRSIEESLERARARDRARP